MAKYLTKELMLSVSPGKKRVSTSRDIRLFTKKKQQGWSWNKQHIDDYFREATSHGIDCTRDEDDSGIRSFLAYMPNELRQMHLDKEFRFANGKPKLINLTKWPWNRYAYQN
jgi:hypothetical protein